MGGDNNRRDQLPLPGFALAIVQDCRVALELELAEVRRRGDRFDVRNGRILHSSTTTTYLLFEAVLPRHVVVGTRGSLTVDQADGGESIGVELVAVADSTVVFASESAKTTSLPSTMIDATVDLSSAWLIEALDARLHEYELGGGDDVLLEELMSPDLGEYQSPSTAEPTKSFNIDHDAQTSQARAARSALEPGLRFVWGPPGTGKTTVLAETVRLAVEEGRRVLVLAHSNIAVDVAMERIGDVLDQELVDTGRVLRIGYPVLESVASNDGLSPTKVASRQHPGLADRMAAIEAELSDLARSAAADNADGPAIAAKFPLLRDEYSESSRQLKAAEAALVDNALVIGTTIAKATVSDQIWDWSKDLVIVDEASMVGMPTVLALVLRGADTLSFFGDFRQLPPVAVSTSERVREWFGRDVFEFAGVREAQETGQPDARTAVLTVQFRMSEGVCAVVNDLAYDGLLRTHPTARNRGIRLADNAPFETDEVVIVDVSALSTRSEVAAAPDSFSRCNLASAAMTAAIGAHASVAGVSVGLLSPYREQAALLAELITSAENIDAATAHRFQGGERDVVVVDLVDAPPLDGPSRLTGKDPDLTLRLLNVAASRARGKLIVVADLDFLHDRHPLSSPALHLVHAASRSGAAVVPADALLESLANPTSPGAGSTTFPYTVFDSIADALVSEQLAGSSLVEANLPNDELWVDEFVGALRALIAHSVVRPIIRCTTRSSALIDDFVDNVSLMSCGHTGWVATDSSLTVAVGDGAISFHSPTALSMLHRFFGVN